MKHNLDVKDITALVMLLCGIIMAFIALFLPPPGQIHDSVLYLFAQILIYAGSIFGIDAYIRKAIDNRNHELGRNPRPRLPTEEETPPAPHNGGDW